MNSLTQKLSAVFLVILIVPLITGINGMITVRNTRETLTENSQSLQELTDYLTNMESSLAENAELQTRASDILYDIDQEEREVGSTLRAMVEVLLPRSFVSARIRFALTQIEQAERTMLLGVNMRHITGDDLVSFYETQKNIVRSAMIDLDGAIENVENTISPNEDRTGWEGFKTSLDRWRGVHTEFIAKSDALYALAADLIRGGPQFTNTLREAYDIIFISGHEIRNECVQRLAELNDSTLAMAAKYSRSTIQMQSATRSQVESLIQTYRESTERSAQLRDRFSSTVRNAINAARTSEVAFSNASDRFWLTTVISITGVVITALVGLFIAWRIAKPVQKIVSYMSTIAQGDLSIDIPEKDRNRKDEVGMLAKGLQEVIQSTRTEIHMADSMANGDYTVSIPIRSKSDQLGQALNVMLNNTNKTLTGVSTAIDHINNGAVSMLQAAHSLSQGSKTAAEAVDDISRAVRHVDEQAQENASHAAEASELAITGSNAAQRGYTAMTDLVSAMDETRESSQKIVAVAKLIDDIAFQTNLLALNAAVEAARAGRHGRGFSVVADEVRNLAGRSAKAARETGEMIKAMNDRMETEMKMATRSDQEFRDIVTTIQKVANIVDDISKSSTTQSDAIAQITDSLSRIDKVIQQNTDNSGHTAESAQLLSRQVEELRGMIRQFKLFDSQGRLYRSHDSSIIATTEPSGHIPHKPENKYMLPLDDQK